MVSYPKWTRCNSPTDPCRQNTESANIEYAVLFDDVTLLPLAADGVFYVFDLGMKI